VAATIPELSGDFYAGVDLAKKEDFSVIAILRRDPDAFRLIHLKVFPQGTEYVAVTNYMKALGERLKTIHKFLVDQTGVGEAVLEEARKTLRGIADVEGVVLTAPAKQEILGYLKLMMQEKRVLFPYELDFLQELNVERFELSKSGQILFSHPSGTHDDRFWAFALAVFATKTAPYPQLKRSHTRWLDTVRTAGGIARRISAAKTRRRIERISRKIARGEIGAWFVDTDGEAGKIQGRTGEGIVSRLAACASFSSRARGFLH
jgi:hypothetical protein